MQQKSKPKMFKRYFIFSLSEPNYTTQPVLKFVEYEYIENDIELVT